ncbi:hypothetical protein B0T10DRAFT_218965 [Thelonectria olida]|uniref:J domain-containing protein n=1 Tax=Thelonectria olida TaxID=1576542 RepID=A0A9P9AQU0_9HYPO|nr:hypothetical protein B0T10DRAFT_218965 [Thelonectria olida]
MGSTRDYYADLELPPSADVQDIKKQFRKLALKYHPDRNPGREQEVNQKFQVIQSAHEILSDPEQKSKYDASRARSRYPMASGVRGNPWANAGDQFPPPPRRNQSTRAAHSGAQRYQTRFTQGVPPTAKQNNGPNPDLKQNAARAFENMRKPQASAKPAEQPRPNPPPPPPRTESARQRAQASFGTRKAGYHPRSATHGDESPVASSNYNTNYNTRPVPPPPVFSQDNPEPTPMPDPLRQFREQGSAAEPRSPYTSRSGERTNPFDGVPLGRAKSARETSHVDTPSPDFDMPTRQRSFNVRKEKTAEEPTPGMKGPVEGQESPTKFPVDARPKAPLKKTRSGQPFASTAESFNTRTPDVPIAETPTKPENATAEGPSMYATPPCIHIKRSNLSVQGCGICRTYSSHVPHSTGPKRHQDDVASPSFCNSSPSGVKDSPLQLTPFERKQQEVLAQLIENAVVITESAEKRKRAPNTQIPPDPDSTNHADTSFSNSFSFPVDDETFASPSPKHPKVSRSSTDDINTRFVDDDEAWQFSAGGSEQGTPTKPRPPPGSRPGRRSPLKRPTIPRSETSSVASEPGNGEPAFNPEGWSKEFGPHTFQPPPPQPKPASPTRSMRGNSKKGRPTKPSGMSADNDSSSEEEELAWPGRKAQQGGPVAAESPQAMDIDSPPAKPVTPPVVPTDQTETPNGARNINVEPSRPEWRPGNAEGVNGEAKSTTPPTEASTTPPTAPPTAPTAVPMVPPKVPFNPNAAGSEDSEEFMANFSELKNVAPFAKQDSGLRSFEDLKDTLPFDSKPSSTGPIKIPKPRPLLFPAAPVGPTLPMVAINGRKPDSNAWGKYVKEFDEYLQHWDIFNETVLSHYNTRQKHISSFRKNKGYSFLEARSDADILEYFSWVQQDQEVRKKWTDACEEHEQKIREFMAFRMKMK